MQKPFKASKSSKLRITEWEFFVDRAHVLYQVWLFQPRLNCVSEKISGGGGGGSSRMSRGYFFRYLLLEGINLHLRIARYKVKLITPKLYT